jgi:hypothetical protein
MSTLIYLLAQDGSQIIVEALVQTLDTDGEIDDLGEIHILRVHSAVLQEGGHEPTAELLAGAHNLIHAAGTDLPERLRGFEDLENPFTFPVDIGHHPVPQVHRFQLFLGNVDMLQANGLDE